MGGYFQNHVTKNTQFPDLNDGVNLRRGRIFFNAKYGEFYAIITPDFGGSPDGSPTLYEANLNWVGFKPVTATVGYFKPYFSLYDSQSSNNFLLMERPSIVEIARNVAAGDARATVGAKAANDGISLPFGVDRKLFRIRLSDRRSLRRAKPEPSQRGTIGFCRTPRRPPLL